ncbi:CARDB domain-containing protein [Thermococcus litoralis]|nr:CARDB domain-containing protein [Thermococcus litoralis]
MDKRAIVLITILFLLPISGVSAQPSLLLEVTQKSFEAKPGETISVPITLSNIGNETAENITIYISGPLVEGLLYSQDVIKKLEPGEKVEKTLPIYIENPKAGVYDLKVVARVGAVLIEVPISLRILTKVSYSIDIDVKDRYLFGEDVAVTLKVSSSSNGIIFGDVSYEIYRENVSIAEKSIHNIFLYPEYPKNRWEYVIFLPKPDAGKYTVVMRTRFGGISKTITKSFEVYQRKLRYETKFEKGIIYVRVLDEGGNGVEGIPVTIEGTELKTNSYGIAFVEAKEPGTYHITLNLDGKIVETFVEVKKLFMAYEQRNETLLVYVRDSAGKGIGNVTIEAIGPIGKTYSITDENGTAVIDLNETGFGSISLKAESDRYLGAEAIVTVKEPKKPETETPTQTTSTPINQTTPIPPVKPKDYGNLPLILVLSAIIFGSTSYLALFKPLKFEEQLDKYYFVKVRAPRLRELRNFRYEKAINAVDARATKGKVAIEDGKVIWEIDKLEPGEEAFLQVIL